MIQPNGEMVIYFYDGIHPTPNGYKAMYEQVLKDFTRNLLKEDHLSMSYQNS
mgnify:CR=1 FL=1